MSWTTFIDRLGEVAKKATMATPPGMIWDMAKSFADQNDGKGGYAAASDALKARGPLGNLPGLGIIDATMQTATAKDPSTGQGFGLFQAAHFPYDYLVNRPAGTFIDATGLDPSSMTNLAASAVQNIGRGGSPVKPGATDLNVWRNSWNKSDYVSNGQFLAAQRLGRGDAGSDETQAYFHNDPVGKIVSGVYDFGANLLDPTFAAGKGLKALRVAGTTFKTNEARDLALNLSAGHIDEAGVKAAASKGSVAKNAIKGRTRMDEFLAGTRGQTVPELMSHPQLRDTGDAGALAYWFHRVDQESATDAAALAGKRDILAAALGNRQAIDQLSARHAALVDEMNQMTRPVDMTQANALFTWDDNGQAMVDFFNPAVSTEIADRTSQINDTLVRLERLQNVAGSTSKFGTDTLDRFTRAARDSDLHETVLFDGAGNRPIRVVRGTVGKAAPGFINTKVTDDGLDELRRVLGRSSMDGATRADLLQRYATAPTRESRYMIVRSAEQAIFKAEGERFGKTPQEIDKLLALASGRRATIYNKLRANLYSAAPDASYVRFVDGEDGMVHAFDRPFLQSQLEDMAAITDPRMLQKVLKQESRTGWLKEMTDAGGQASDLAKNAAQLFTAGWKNFQLMRGAYAFRIQVDSQMRLMASLGSLAYAATASRGVRNFGRRLAGDQTASDLIRSEFHRTFVDEAKVAEVTPKLELLNARLASRQGGRLDPAVTAKIQAKRDALMAELDNARSVPINVAPAVNPDELDMLRRTLQSHTSRDIMLSDGRDQILRGWRGTGRFGSVKGAAPHWGDSYLRAVNRQIRNSPTAMRMLSDYSNESVAQFVRSNADAAKEWANFSGEYGNELGAWLERVRAHVNHYLPDPAQREVVLARPMNGDDLTHFFDDVTKRMDVHGEEMNPFVLSPIVAQWQRFRNFFYKWASDMPESVMARHPLYNARFRQHMQDAIDRVDNGVLTSADVSRARRIADRKARIDMGNTMFDLSDVSSTAHLARFVSPFFAAWEDTMVKWGRLLYDDPSRAVRLGQAWTAPNKAGAVTLDDQGNEKVILPKAFAPIEGAGGLSFFKGSFNIVFQGDPWWAPGFGPLVQVPVNEIIKSSFPEAAKNPAIQFVLPMGVNDGGLKDQLLPAWVRKAQTAFSQNSDDYKQTYKMLLAQETVKYQMGQRRKPPTREEIANATRNWHLMRALTSFGAPVTANPEPEFQFYIDEAHRYRNDDANIRAAYKQWQASGSQGDAPPSSWEEKFYRDYPHYFEMGLSLSTNNTGIVASAQAYDATKAHRKQIAENPEFGWYFVGPDNTGPFDQGVYAFQKSQEIGYGNTTHFRSVGDPVTALHDIQAERGWMDYRKGSTMIQLELEARGLHSLSQRGAEDLAAAKRQFVSELEAENPSWATAKRQRDESKAHDFLVMATANMSGDLTKRPDIAALREYLDGRRWIKTQMQARGIQRLPEADNSTNPNADLRAAWDEFTSSLVAQNMGFEQMWQRALESDDLTGDF